MIPDFPSSYYAASIGTPPLYNALEGVRRVDLCIIGGGYTGLSAALYAARKGLSTVLLEARRIGWGASGRNGGQAIPGFRKGADELVRLFGPERARALFAVAMEARDYFWSIIKDNGLACDAYQTGHLTAAAKFRDMAALEREHSCLTEVMGYDQLDLLGRQEIRDAIASKAFHGGLRDRGGGHVHPLKLALGLADLTTQAGATVHENTRVLGVEQTGKLVTLNTFKGKVTAHKVIVACDSYVGGLFPKFDRRLMTIANYNIATEPLDEEDIARLIPGNEAVSDTRFVVNYFRRSADNRLLFGGGEKYTPAPPHDVVGFVRPFLLKLFPQLADAQIDYAWGGQVSITSTRFPHVGREGNLYFAQGYSGQGVILANFMGKLMVDAMIGAPEQFNLLRDLPTHSFPGGAVFRTPLYIAAMLWYALRDRL